MIIDLPEGCDSFKAGMILLDEAVGQFMKAEHEYAYMLENVIGAIVRALDPTHIAEPVDNQLT